MDKFSRRKRFIHLGEARIAYCEEGEGEPLLLLHGCPFSSFIWRKAIPPLAAEYRCIAPDLLGLGDTETPPDADWSLRSQAEMVPVHPERDALHRASRCAKLGNHQTGEAWVADRRTAERTLMQLSLPRRRGALVPACPERPRGRRSP